MGIRDRHIIGVDNLLWGSDYPHPDGVWPDSKTVIAENLGTLNERIRRKIICDNAAKLYGFVN
jgi:predicted TIM-barrel fold metal-dependent hydrolase